MSFKVTYSVFVKREAGGFSAVVQKCGKPQRKVWSYSIKSDDRVGINIVDMMIIFLVKADYGYKLRQYGYDDIRIFKKDFFCIRPAY